MEHLHYVFVYGTLKKKHGNHGVLGGSRFIGEAVTVEDCFSMFDGGFPWVSDEIEGNGRIVGELYEVRSKNILDNLDRLEGVPYMYIHRETDVTTLDGFTFPAIMYVASKGSNERLKERVPMKTKGRSNLLEWVS